MCDIVCVTKTKEVTLMAQITIKELYYGDKYAVMSEVFKTMFLASPNRAGGG